MKNKPKKPGLIGKVTKYFLVNKELTVLLIVALFFFGIFSFIVIPKQYNPKIVAPAFNIITEFPGADSQEVYELITRPMEVKVKEVEGVDKIMSRSIEGGVSIVTVQFFVGRDLEEAKISLMQKIQGNIDLKPLGVQDPIIKTIDPELVPIMTVGLSSNQVSEEALRKLAFDIKQDLKTIENISLIEVKGGRKKALRVDLDLSRLQGYGISVNRIIDLIEKNNLNAKVGSIETEKNNYSVKIQGNIYKAKDFEKLVILNDQEGKVYLKDIASISYDKEDINDYTRLTDKDRGQKVVFLAISKTQGSNVVQVSKNVSTKLEKIKKDIPLDVQVRVLKNDGAVAQESVNDLTTNLMISILIVSFVLYLFLGLRSALVVSISIPLTLAVVIGMGLLFDKTINRITLFALILSLGLLVDSATVVIENIFRFFNKQKSKNRLNRREKIDLVAGAVDQVGPGLVMSTVTTILAFYPMAFVTGMMGPYMGPIPFFVPMTLIASLLIAITINPFLAFILSQNKGGVEKQKQRKKRNFFLNLIAKIQDSYEKFITKLLDSRQKTNLVLIVTVVLFLIAMSFPGFKIVKFRMLPKADKDQFYLYVDLPKNTSLEKTDKTAKQITQMVLKEEDVVNVQSFVGIPPVLDFNGLFKGSEGRDGKNQATLKINLRPKDSRNRTSEEIVLKTRESFKQNQWFQKQVDLKLKFIEDPPGPPVLSTFLVKISGDNTEKINEITREIENMTLQIEGVEDVDNNLIEDNFEYIYRIDKEKANILNVDAQNIVTTLNALLDGVNVGLYHESPDGIKKPEQEYIFLRLKKEDRDQFSDFDRLFVLSNSGEKIELSELIYKSREGGESLIYSDNKKKTNYVTAEMGERSVTYASIDMLGKLLKYKLPDQNGQIISRGLGGVEYLDKTTDEKYSIHIDGEWKLTLDVFRDLGIAMAVAVFLIYLVLVAQFKSFIDPLLIMGTIPLAMIGVMPGFAVLGLVKGVYFNATSMIGVIALSGIVVNNAIILLTYINDLREKDMELKSALIKAGKTRLLPILLTSMTTILGSLTIISDPVWEGLAWSIFWGLSLSSFLTLVIFPLIYFKFKKS